MNKKIMIKKTNNWQQLLADCVTNYHELLHLLNLSVNDFPDFNLSSIDFPLRVPKGFVAKMKKGDAHDPLLRQILPVENELHDVPGFTKDPLKETKVNHLPGLLHKFHGRVLLTVTGACPINCRYCFRRYFAYQENNPGTAGWLKALDYIDNDSSINEVILSGGEPLLASDMVLKNLLERIEAIDHIKTLRIHTRMPVVMSERITDSFLELFAETSLRCVMVLHINHPNEIDKPVGYAISRLRSLGFTVLSQSVLLKGVNDSLDILEKLSQDLFAHGVLPYYLHTLDKISGAAHFDVPEEKAKELIHLLRAKLPGYLVPRLAKEVAGQASKSILA